MTEATEYLAHETESLKDHLKATAELCKRNAAKIGCAHYGELLGLLHDLGKYSEKFQKYLRTAIGKENPDEDEVEVDSKESRGTIDHSTAGAQFVWQKLGDSPYPQKRLLAQILALCLCSHHSGLIDCLKNDRSYGSINVFSKRLKKADEKTHCHEVLEKSEVSKRVEEIITQPNFIESLIDILNRINLKQSMHKNLRFFHIGLFLRFLFSCLIDADRQDSSDSEKPNKTKERQQGFYICWEELANRLEGHITEKFGEPNTAIAKIRTEISKNCLFAATREKGIFTLTVPTGGGKTLASLRFALTHARKHKLDRIYYIVPFTTTIDQNAREVRGILEKSAEKGKIVLEHHSNIGAGKQTWKEKLLCENWDAPIVFTTMVQFLEAFFGGGTRGVRRMHQLANALIIFDEIQALPIKCVHLFCNAVNFLVEQCGSSVMLCTATQPLLKGGDSSKGEGIDPSKGALDLSEKNEIMPDISKLFRDLKRVEVCDLRSDKGRTTDEVADLAEKGVANSGSCLVVVNLKRQARALYAVAKSRNKIPCFYLTTNMCSAHRKSVFEEIKQYLCEKKPILCISTNLIECGVDISFGSAIRYVAGLDSIAQTAGRCNRHSEMNVGKIYIVNPVDENLNCLEDIKTGRQKAEHVLDDYRDNPEKYHYDPIGPELIMWYYENYFFSQRESMDYPLSKKTAGRTDSILNLLSLNGRTVNDYKRKTGKEYSSGLLPQAFMTAGELFKSINAPTESIIVPFGNEGKDIINRLCSVFEVEKQYNLLKEAQQYSVNVYPGILKDLKKVEAICPVQRGTEIYYLKKEYYSAEFGISVEKIVQSEVYDV